MNTLKILLFFIFSTQVYAQTKQALKSTPRKIIDLGDMEVQGELRRPNLFMVESSKRLAATVEKSAERKWNLFEDTLLKTPNNPRVDDFLKSSP
jgi:hypothetical protein